MVAEGHTVRRDTRTVELPTEPLLDRPIFIIGCNRSGTTLLFQTLSRHFSTWSAYVEQEPLFHTLWPIDDARGDRVEPPVTAFEAASLRAGLYERAHNKQHFAGSSLLRSVPEKLWQRPTNVLYKSPPVRLVEKTPSNCFRVPILADLWPDARFIYIVRKPEATISSLMEGWERGGYRKDHVHFWKYLAPPGWRERLTAPLKEIAAWQWVESNRTASRALDISGADYLTVRHEDLLDDPRRGYGEILDFCDLPWTERFAKLLDRQSERVWTRKGSPPEKGKWKRLHGEEVQATRNVWQPLKEELGLA